MPRILVLNNYPLDQVWEEVKRGEKPDHHLYGINHFQAQGYEVEIVPFRRSRLLHKLSSQWQRSKLPLPLGDLDQQWSALRLLRRGDILYAPCQTQTRGLAYLRALRLLRAPLVNLAHHPLEQGRFTKVRRPFLKAFARGTSSFPSLNTQVAQEINRLAGKRPKSRMVPWGPDANFYPGVPQSGRGVVAAGRTGRDFVTFGAAAAQTSSPAHIICLRSDVHPDFTNFSSQVKVTVEPDQNYMKYPELLKIYAEARVLAIPLLAGVNLSGLTSLMDALGMGKPVIMTRHPLIDLDIEAEGIGRWVEPGDVEGWRAAIQFFEDHADEAFAMGQRARALVEGGFNSASFASEMTKIFQSLS